MHDTTTQAAPKAPTPYAQAKAALAAEKDRSSILERMLGDALSKGPYASAKAKDRHGDAFTLHLFRPTGPHAGLLVAIFDGTPIFSGTLDAWAAELRRMANSGIVDYGLEGATSKLLGARHAAFQGATA